MAIQGYEHPLAFVFLFFIQAHLGSHYLPRNATMCAQTVGEEDDTGEQVEEQVERVVGEKE